ncbi:hypothetical protein D3C85_1308410 [compost metagenome]
MVATKPPAISTPGTMPAMNRSPMEICANTPKMTNSIDGGITGANKAPAAVVAVAKLRS